MNKIVIVTGTPGAGKTSIVNGAMMNGKELSYKTVSMGTEMNEIAVKNGYVKNRDEMRKLHPKVIEKLRAQALKKINKMKGNLIIDTHATVKSGNRYVPGFSSREINILEGLKAFIYVDSEATDIIIRRARDLNRKRDVDNIEELKQQRELNLSLITSYSIQNDVPLPIFIIENKENKLDHAIAQAEEILADIFKNG